MRKINKDISYCSNVTELFLGKKHFGNWEEEIIIEYFPVSNNRMFKIIIKCKYLVYSHYLESIFELPWFDVTGRF